MTNAYYLDFHVTITVTKKVFVDGLWPDCDNSAASIAEKLAKSETFFESEIKEAIRNGNFALDESEPEWTYDFMCDSEEDPEITDGVRNDEEFMDAEKVAHYISD